MGTVYKKTVTRPLPKRAELFTKNGQQFARWKPAKGKTRTAKVTTGADGSPRILDEAGTYIAKFRDGSGYVREVSTGCRDEDAARSILSKLERRAELVKSEVISATEAATADHLCEPFADHFGSYLLTLQAKDVSPKHLIETERLATRLARDCQFVRLGDVGSQPVERWLVARKVEGMSARTRNSYSQSLSGFCKWCVQTERLASNPLARIAKADEKSDRRRQRRAMTEAELVKLLEVARLRPLAEFGRETLAVDGSEAEATGKRRKRSNWTYKPLTLDSLHAATKRARERLADNPEFVEKLERLGRERALIYKTLVLTGLRKGELASLTVGQLELDGAMPFVVLNAADEKNRQGSTIPLRHDLANDLRDWLSDTPNAATLRLLDDRGIHDSKRPLFLVPESLGKILDRDLFAAGIDKADERGRTIDVHALRHSFGTLLSKGGVAPRTAQAAMRHSNINLTMNVYTDPKLLDIQGALDSLPSLNLKSSPSTERQAMAMRATGTDVQDAMPSLRHPVSLVAPPVAPNIGQRGQSVSFAVISSDDADERMARRATHENHMDQSKKALPAVIASKALQTRSTGLEPAASSVTSWRSNQLIYDPSLVPARFFEFSHSSFSQPERAAILTPPNSPSSKPRLLQQPHC